MKTKKTVCTSCQICGEEKDANLRCTLILDGAKNIENACWCVCNDCSGKFDEDIASYYKTILSDM